MRQLLEILLLIAGAYVALGFLFSLYFVWRGAARIDANAQHSPLGFRLLILPGTVAFWPLLLSRVRRGGPAPLERNAHRDAAVMTEPQP